MEYLAEKDKVLVVDDVEVNLIILEEIIKNMGLEAITATSVKEAFSYMQQGLPQVILSDISMPDIDGYTFCNSLKKDPYTRDIPVIFISAMDSSSDLSQGFAQGAVDYITKPFDKTEVEMRITTHLKLYHLQKDLEENNRRLSSIVTRQIEKLRLEQKNIMFALAKLVESRENMSHDQKTGFHYSNVNYNSRILAQGMQLSPAFENQITDEFIETIESSAGLHDIGKILIPDSILLKKGKLTDEEREVMKTHTEVGAKTMMEIYEGIERNEFINMAIDIAYYHHENWNGSGYPKGLKGTEIPLAARIVKVIDVFDALVNDRLYHPSITFEEGIAEMKKNSGVQFDPQIMEVFMKIYRNFKGVNHKDF